jgi:hypothetical protein
MGQYWIVGLIVGLAAVYSVWYVLPRAVRQRLGRLHSALGRSPSCSSACERCGKCEGAGIDMPQASAPTQTGQVHFKK